MPVIANPILQFSDVDGVWGFAKAYITDSGTTTPAVVYQDEEFLTPHTYPIQAGGDGLFPPIHFDPTKGLLRLRVIKETGDLATPPVDVDPINSIDVAIGDFVINVPGNPSGTNTWLGGIGFNRPMTITHDFAGTRGKKPKSLPSADYAAVVKATISGVETTVATITCSHTTGVWAISGTGLTDLLPEDGDELDVYGPGTAEPAIADFGFIFALALR